MQPRILRVLVCLAAALLVFAGWRTAGAAAPAQNTDVLAALLTEVRGLRVAMEQMASAGPRVQLAMGRLQLQEQRINNLLRQLDSVRAALSERQSRQADMERQIASLEIPGDKAKDNPEMRQAVEEQLRSLKAEAPLLSAEILRLQSDESSLSQQVSAEQGRWSDINRQLEDLERSLARQK